MQNSLVSLNLKYLQRLKRGKLNKQAIKLISVREIMAENTNLFSDFSGSYTSPENIKRKEDEEETNLFSEFSGSYISSKPAIQEEAETPIAEEPVEEPKGFFDKGFDYISEQVNALPTARGGRFSLPELFLKGADFLDVNPFKENVSTCDSQTRWLANAKGHEFSCYDHN